MKYLLVFIIVALLAWRWRTSRANPRSSSKSDGNREPTTMRPCDRCGLHVPARESIAGKLGFYCCQEHLQQAEP